MDIMETKSWNKLAIIAFALSIVPFILLLLTSLFLRLSVEDPLVWENFLGSFILFLDPFVAIVLGIVAYYQTKVKVQRGKNLAILAIIISLLYKILILFIS